MRKRAWLVASLCVVLSGHGFSTAAQSAAPGQAAESAYRFLDAEKTKSLLSPEPNVGKVAKLLAEAGADGYDIRLAARWPWSLNLLLQRGDGRPRRFEVIHEAREGPFLRELNEAGARGFSVVRGTVKWSKRFDWVGVVERGSGTSRFTYSITKGAQEVTQALASSGDGGRVMAGLVVTEGFTSSRPVVFLEEAEPAGADPSTNGKREYRIVSTARTSSLENDIRTAAAEGFRVVDASAPMTVLMARSAGTIELREYRVIAAARIPTAVSELSGAGAEGFRIAAVTENALELVFVVERAAGAVGRYEYRLPILKAEDAARVLADAEAEGFAVTSLLSEIVVLERPSSGSAGPE